MNIDERMLRRCHPLTPPVVLLLLAVPAAILAVRGAPGPFVAWVVMGAAAGYSISGSV
ncbi:hypothetical protein ACFP2T_18710 [Plantactinospora solaniradicis]|uniref:Uncharacterized protein n=1 Tax=Plantactinospora solaniradicis TaxID=1723736 RepID=A0ABW1K8V3_9ACTN